MIRSASRSACETSTAQNTQSTIDKMQKPGSREALTPVTYMPQLDGLRAVAVSLVILSHWTSFQIFRQGAEIGVQLFFVLSGFLITGILLDARGSAEIDQVRKKNVFRAFYIRRFLRIFPIYYAVLAVTFVIGIPPVRESIYWHLLYLSNFYLAEMGQWQGYVSHLWSLAVEEQFYLIWPLLILLVARIFLQPLIVGLIVFSIAFRFVLGPALGIEPIAISVFLISSVDALMIGAFLALKNNIHNSDTGANYPSDSKALFQNYFAWISVFFLGYASLLFMKTHAGSMGNWDVPISIIERVFFLLGALVLVEAASRGMKGVGGRFLESEILVYIGKISYGIYLLHNFIPYIMENVLLKIDLYRWVESSKFLVFIINLFALLTISSFSWVFFEKKVNQLKKYFPYHS